VVLSQEQRVLSDDERRLMLEVADELVYEAGRTTLALALRGSRNRKLDRYKVAELPGYGMYRGMPEEEVLARIDQLVHEGILWIRWSDDGFPLLAYTNRGLELAETFTVERWLALLREHVEDDEPFEPPFAYHLMPNRNPKTFSRLLDAVETTANAAWLPLLTEWSATEVKKVRARLAPLIKRLGEGAADEGAAPPK
jgi:hypothetical protein